MECKRVYSYHAVPYCTVLFRERSLCSWFNIDQLRGMSRKRVRYTFDVHFGSQEEKAAFVCRLKRVRELPSPEDDPPLEWFSSRGIIRYSIYTFRAFARSIALTRGTGYNTFFYEFSTCYSTQECWVEKALMSRMPPDT